MFQDNVIINDAEVLAHKEQKFHIRWKNQEFCVADMTIEKVVDKATLDENPDVLKGYTRSSENQVPQSLYELKTLVAVEVALAESAETAAEQMTDTDSETEELPAKGAILFKNNVVVENAEVISTHGKMISVRWKDQTFSINEKYIKRVLDPETLERNPKLLGSCKNAHDYIFPNDVPQLKELLIGERKRHTQKNTGISNADTEAEASRETEGEYARTSLGGKFGIFGHLGYAGAAMGDVNRYLIDTTNKMMAAYQATGSLSPINGGVTINGGVQYGLNDNLLIGTELFYQSLESKTTFTNTRAPYETIDWTFDFPMFSAGAFLKVVEPLNNRFLLTGGVGIDYLFAFGMLLIKDSLGNRAYDTLTSSGVGFKFMGGAQFFFARKVSLGLDVGYRYAVLDRMVTSDGVTMQVDYPRRNMCLDYSGEFIRAGINVFFGGNR